MRRKLPYILLATSLVVAGFATWWWAVPRPRTLQIMPGRFGFVYAYEDRPDSSGSMVESRDIGAQGLRLRFRLGPSAFSYVGAGGELYDAAKGSPRWIDLSEWDSVRVRLRGEVRGDLKMLLIGMDSGLYKPGDHLSRRFSETYIADRAEQREFCVSVSEFRLARWWIAKGFVSTDDTIRRLDRFQGFQFQILSRSIQDTGLQELQVESLVLVGEEARDSSILWALSGLLAVAGIASAWSGLRRSPIEVRKNGTEARPRPLVLGDGIEDYANPLMAFLEEHYARTELDAESVCKETGIPRSRLAEAARAAFGRSFKGHLNELRLVEAQRLLQATDRGVSEIAFAVGYNSVAHFNRVFKDRFGRAPGDERATKQAS